MIVVLVMQLLLLFSGLLWFATQRHGGPALLTAAVIVVTALVAGVLVAGIWVWPPRWTISVAAVAAVAAMAGIRRERATPPEPRPAYRWISWVLAALFATTGALGLWQGWASRRLPAGAETLDLAQPLRGDRFCAISGGTTALMNLHMATLAPRMRNWRGQSYGVDLVAFDAAGLRTVRGQWWKPQPRDPRAYRAFGAQVLAPCSGRITVAVDDHPDQAVGTIDRDNLPGNHVVLVCGSHEVLLAHFQRGSLSVRVGQQVEVADPIARIGNTGNSSEPHLHLSVQRPDARAAWLGGRPVHVTFRGRVITRNACLPTG